MEYWFTKSVKRILVEHMGILSPSLELMKWVTGYLDNVTIRLGSNPTLDLL